MSHLVCSAHLEQDLYLPDTGKAAHVDVPALLNALGADDVHALRVTADLCSIQCLSDHVDQLLLVHALRPSPHAHGSGNTVIDVLTPAAICHMPFCLHKGHLWRSSNMHAARRGLAMHLSKIGLCSLATTGTF